MAQFIVETEFGNITLTKNVIADTVRDAVKEFRGKVFIATHKGKPVKPGSSSESNSIDIEFDNNMPDIKVYVLIRFGTSIAAVTNKLIENIQENVKNILGKEPNSVSVVVKGTISKNIAKRNIEVTG